MEITYDLPWTHIQKGTVIGLNETPYVQGAGEPLWKILKIDKHGHAEIIPYNTSILDAKSKGDSLSLLLCGIFVYYYHS